jgi:twitching motility protein PilT
VHQIYSAIQAGKKHGMQTMNDALFTLYMSREVSLEECLRASGDANELMRMCGETPLEDQEMGTVEKSGRPAARR